MPQGEIILSDACGFAVSENGQCGSLIRFGQSWAEIYIPISRTQVLVGKRNDKSPNLGHHQINCASAELSFSHIYASKLTTEVRDLVPLIGIADPVMDREEIGKVVEEGWEGHGQMP